MIAEPIIQPNCHKHDKAESQNHHDWGGLSEAARCSRRNQLLPYLGMPLLAAAMQTAADLFAKRQSLCWTADLSSLEHFWISFFLEMSIFKQAVYVDKFAD